jgi:hypothetical protein
MDSEHEQFDLLALRKRGRIGEQIEKYFRLLCFVLHSWHSYKGQRNGEVDQPSSRTLTAIPFDKLVTFVSRLWNELHRQSGRITLDELREEIIVPMGEDQVTFPCPLQELPGKHGPGFARFDGRDKPIYILEYLYNLQRDDFQTYFVVKPTNGNPSDPDTVIEPGIPIRNKKEFLSKFTERERELVADLGNSLRKLNASEMRAIGTHQDLPKTLDAIRWEFKALDRRGTCKLIHEALGAGIEFTKPAREWLEYASEAVRKSGGGGGITGNQDDYHTGWLSVQADLTDENLRRAFADVQRPAAEIWDSPEIISIRRIAIRSKALAQYLLAVSMGIGNSAPKSAKELKDAKMGCDECGIGAGLPTSVETIYNEAGGLVSSVRVLLQDRLNDIFNAMKSC